jgi:hypothetical protein
MEAFNQPQNRQNNLKYRDRSKSRCAVAKNATKREKTRFVTAIEVTFPLFRLRLQNSRIIVHHAYGRAGGSSFR